MLNVDILAKALILEYPHEWVYEDPLEFERDCHDWDILFAYHRDESDPEKARAAAEVIARRYDKYLG